MNREHLAFHSFLVLIAGIVLLFVYLSVASLLVGLEELRMGNSGSMGWTIFFSFWYGFTATTIGFVFYQTIKLYLDARTHKVPEVCPECNEYIDIYNVKWIKPEKKAECPYCGISLKVTKVWE